MGPNYWHQLTPSGQNNPKTKPKRRVLTAVTLGLLTFVITPLVAVVFAIPFLLLGETSEAFNPIIIIAQILGLRELSGFFTAQFILIGFLALTGDFATAIISGRSCHLTKMAVLTFFSALTFQLAAVGIIIPITLKLSQSTMQVGIDREKAYGKYAAIGDISYKVHGQYSDREITNLHPEYGPLYKKLEIVVPLSIS